MASTKDAAERRQAQEEGDPQMTADRQAIRDAATIVLWREGPEGPEVVMGQRGAAAAFMPNKFVFPGGAVDREDASVPLAAPLNADCRRRLADLLRPDALTPLPETTLAVTAIRELWEETGLKLARPSLWPEGAVPADWAPLAAEGLLPDASGLKFVFRAITPPGRPRRFDARFFLAKATGIAGDADDFSGAQDELAALQWIPVRKVRSFDLPFITEVVMAEISFLSEHGETEGGVPFFDNSGPVSIFRRIV